MLIGAHVSPAGGLAKAIARGEARGCRAIQIFNQSPRMWRPTAYPEEDVAAFRQALRASPIDAVLIHAVYLLNCASEDPEIRAKSRASLIHSLRVGHAIGAAGVVLHPGSAKGGEAQAAIARAAATIGEALGETEGCELHLENTAGTGGTLGRSLEQLAALLEGAGANERLGVCLDSCHLFATGYDIRTPAGADAVVREAKSRLGPGRIRSLHFNDSQTALGSNRDRHANVGEGELGEGGASAFLSARGLQRLPCVLETPGENREGPGREEVARAMELRERGLQARRRPARPSDERGGRNGGRASATGGGNGPANRSRR
jgi:deoxyribonuclease-4